MCDQCGTQSMESNNCTGNTCVAVADKDNVVVKDEDSITSLKSSGSSVSLISSSSDASVDANLNARGDVVESGIKTSQENLSSSSKMHLPNFTIPVENELVQGGSTASPSLIEENDETDDKFWLPPEPENQEDDDVVSSFTRYDDDDDDNIQWRNTDSLIGFDEKGSVSYNYKEEQKKALDEVMNGKFKALVDQLLRSVNGGEHWVDIVTFLSWEAAAYIKPENSDGKSIDPDGYVKIKCIATGSTSQSKLIKGLVFKKHAAHKRMPTNHTNPKILLIQGALGLSPSGLSSFKSITEEKDSEKDIIIGMIETYLPNVILVEKTVSRDIQEFIVANKKTVSGDIQEPIVAKGMTLVSDMKLHRLERVARSVSSSILSSESSKVKNLGQCESFYFEKFIEEHAPFEEGGKQPSKTLMFIEGCPTRLGCTILLMGANSDELKRIKYVARCAVVMAYHFMLETSFLLDQRTMFSTVGLNESPPLDANVSFGYMSNAATDSSSVIDIPISNGFDNLNSVSDGNSSSQIIPGFSSLSPSGSCEFMSNNVSVNEKNPDHEIHDVEIEIPISEDNIDEVAKIDEQQQPHSTSSSIVKPLDTQKDDIDAVLDSESILVLISTRNASRGTMCEHSHFSHIKFYRNFDIALGKFLQNCLLNQKLQCKACGESPEAHNFYYAHHNKQLTIQVRRLPVEIKPLPGEKDENDEKLWMWSRCGKCKFQDGSSKSTKLVLISKAARGLSFGKFLELSFSNNSAFDRPASCGHSFHRDFLNFFGFGSMVAIFKYSPLATFSVSLPPEKLDFSNTITVEYLKNELEDVYTKGNTIFLDIKNSLKELQPRFVDLCLKLQGSIKKLSDIEEMLEQEKSQFEVEIQKIVHNGSQDEAAYKNLSLNRVRLELLIRSCVWDRRLRSLLSSDLSVMDTKGVNYSKERQTRLIAMEELPETKVTVERHENVSDNSSHVKIETEVTSVEANDFPLKEISIDGINENGASVEDHVAEPDATVHSHSRSESYPGDNSTARDLSNSQKVNSTISFSTKLENDEAWIWTPISEIFHEYRNELLRGSVPKIVSITSYALESAAHKIITDETSRLHIPLGSDDYIVSDYENEYSSIIACSLALLKDLRLANDDATTYESSHILPRLFSLTSPHWSSGSWDSDNHFQSSTVPDYSNHSSFDGVDLLDSQVSLVANHPEISMGMVKYSGKRKYSVICLYANQFRQLRNRWCPSEDDYIASLSRCMNWDAKGGKSKSFFAKTLDDRFIIKEIKRTEFDSFVKFAPNYFDYMNQCHEHRNQTCLAKILGIYQVIVRQAKTGKETRHDLMVMENLSFGRNFARSYDLKGALHARLITTGDGSGDVLLDQNFVNDMNDSPLYVSRKAKRNLQRGVWNDTTFLNSINVMDYSLLVGVDTEKKELVCGIIDYLRQFTWDKQLETWVKSSLVLPKNQLPTVISPKEYKKRFRKFIDTHFLSVPDHWCSHRSLHPCKLCGIGEFDNSLNTRLEEHEDDSTYVKSLEDEKQENDLSNGKSPEDEKQEEDDLSRTKSLEEGKPEDDSTRGKSLVEEKHQDDLSRNDSA